MYAIRKQQRLIIIVTLIPYTNIQKVPQDAQRASFSTTVVSEIIVLWTSVGRTPAAAGDLTPA